MQGAPPFSDKSGFEDYIGMVLRNATMLAGIDLVVKGDGPRSGNISPGSLSGCWS